jgi:molybdopterin/thiamine biosynthesis adenylyltransferase
VAAKVSANQKRQRERDYSRLATTAFAPGQTEITALVVGAGALGNEVLKNLALLGVEDIWIVDRDVVEASNLTRSVLYCTPDVSTRIASRTPKAVFAAERVKEINPDVEVHAFVGEIADLGYGIIRRADVVFSCLDNEMARLELGWACTRLGKMLVDGGLGLMNYSSGQVTFFPAEAGPCYACRKGSLRRAELLQELTGHEDPCWRKEEAIAAAGSIATTPLMASVVGALQVELGLRGTHATSSSDSTGHAYQITLHPEISMRSVVFDRSPACPLHDPLSCVTTVQECAEAQSDRWTIADLLRAADGDDGFVALDWPLTAKAACRACQQTWEPLVRRARFRRATCPNCGGQDLVETEVLSTVDAASSWASRTLAALGLPRAHVFEVARRSDPDGQRVHVEISGDLALMTEREISC